MAKPKPLPPAMSACSLCGNAVESSKIEAHEREHVVLLHQDPLAPSDAFRADDAARPRRTTVYELRSLKFPNPDGGWVYSTNVFPVAIAKISANLPPGAHVQCVPTHYVSGRYGGEPTTFLTQMMVIIRS